MEINFNADGLVPAVCQDSASGEVLMQAWMNAESLARTRETGEAHFWSRSRQALWHKGGTSGNFLLVDEILVDCDADCLLLKVRPAGPACHTGNRSCFYRRLEWEGRVDSVMTLGKLEAIVRERSTASPDESYTARLMAAGRAARQQKVGEEAVEVIVAAGEQGRQRTVEETADLLYHLLVLLAGEGVRLDDVYAELARRHR